MDLVPSSAKSKANQRVDWSELVDGSLLGVTGWTLLMQLFGYLTALKQHQERSKFWRRPIPNFALDRRHFMCFQISKKKWNELIYRIYKPRTKRPGLKTKVCCLCIGQSKLHEHWFGAPQGPKECVLGHLPSAHGAHLRDEVSWRKKNTIAWVFTALVGNM